MWSRSKTLGLAVSVAVHAGAAAALLLPWGRAGDGDPQPVPAPPIEVELVRESTAGGVPPPKAPPAAQPAPALPQAAPPQDAAPRSSLPPASPPALQPGGTELATSGAPTQALAAPSAAAPAPPPAQPQARTQPDAPPATAAVNLGNGGLALEDLDARSDDIVPPRPDSRYRNLPPAYPVQAMRRREEGTVQLVIHVSADGLPALVEVAGSSGHPSLDGAALAAVERWHFTPARGPAGPVPFTYALAIHFTGDR